MVIETKQFQGALSVVSTVWVELWERAGWGFTKLLRQIGKILRNFNGLLCSSYS